MPACSTNSEWFVFERRVIWAEQAPEAAEEQVPGGLVPKEPEGATASEEPEAVTV